MYNIINAIAEADIKTNVNKPPIFIQRELTKSPMISLLFAICKITPINMGAVIP
jgi:hypothetical protein